MMVRRDLHVVDEPEIVDVDRNLGVVNVLEGVDYRLIEVAAGLDRRGSAAVRGGREMNPSR
jgi:hypothetical protein